MFIICVCLLIIGCNFKKKPTLESETTNYIPISVYGHNDGRCSQKEEMFFKLKDVTYYKVCIEEVNVEYQNLKLYDSIKTALIENRVNLNDIIKLSKSKETEKNCDIYHFDTFNLVISGKKIYILNNKIDYLKYCQAV